MVRTAIIKFREVSITRWLSIIVMCFGLTMASGQPLNPLAEFHRGAYQSAFKLFFGLATLCEPQAQNYLGIMYHLGLGTERNASAARYWFKRAARHGNAAAERNLGTLYGYGMGVGQNQFRAYVWLLRAEQHGNPAAKVALAAMSDKLTANQIMRARGRAAKQALVQLAKRDSAHRGCSVHER